MAHKPNVGRTLETGAILGVLTLILAWTGIRFSPTLLPALGWSPISSGYGNDLYVAHMAAAVLLVAFLVWHLWPFGYSFRRKPGVSLAAQAAAFALLALVVLEVFTGYVLYVRDYRWMDKQVAVQTHLVATFLLMPPLAWHAWRGAKIWRERREARGVAWARASESGRGESARASQQGYTRRAVLRMGAYAAAGFALAAAFGRFVSDQVSAWRLNSIGAIPPLTKENWRLKVTGAVANPIEIDFDTLIAMGPETHRFTHRCVEGWSYTDEWTGVTLRKVLEAAGGVTNPGTMLIFRSPEVSERRATRGQLYTTNFPYREDLLDQVFLVYKVDDEDMPDAHGGPVRIMSPVKWGYKACKWLTEIEVSEDTTYRGYWERRGYHNVGDYPGPIFR